MSEVSRRRLQPVLSLKDVSCARTRAAPPQRSSRDDLGHTDWSGSCKPSHQPGCVVAVTGVPGDASVPRRSALRSRSEVAGVGMRTRRDSLSPGAQLSRPLLPGGARSAHVVPADLRPPRCPPGRWRAPWAIARTEAPVGVGRRVSGTLRTSAQSGVTDNCRSVPAALESSARAGEKSVYT